MTEEERNRLALKIALILRSDPCPHGLPDHIVSRDPVAPWGEGATAKPLCDACVMATVRKVLGES